MKKSMIVIPAKLWRDLYRAARQWNVTPACLIRVLLTSVKDKPVLEAPDWAKKNKIRASLPPDLDAAVEAIAAKFGRLRDDVVAGLLAHGLRCLRRHPKNYAALLDAERVARLAYDAKKLVRATNRELLIAAKIHDMNFAFGLTRKRKKVVGQVSI